MTNQEVEVLQILMSSTCCDRTWQALQEEALRRRSSVPQSKWRHTEVLSTSFSLLLLIMTLLGTTTASTIPHQYAYVSDGP